MFAVKCVVVFCAALSVSAFDLVETDVPFHLYSRTNPQLSQVILASLNSILNSQFSITRPTIFTIHNFGEGVGGNFNAFVVPAHLAAADVNVLAVDWSRGSGLYAQGLRHVEQVGLIIAQFMNILSSQLGYGVNNIRIVGVGLGGHIAGIAARNMNGNVPHIIALDPSYHGWTHNPLILSPNAANVVEVLHTNAGEHGSDGIHGYDYPLGDIDFYPNGGSAQNGCFNIDSCSHIYSYVFYAESINQSVAGGNRFVGTKCENYEEAIAMDCSGSRDAIFGGPEVKQSASGIYTFETNNAQPFARD